tara:strand:- start:1187 stop:1966 length:780 start_codon:yes stop_codon:yes gene_type:complete
MNNKDLKSIAVGLVETFQMAGNESIEIEKQGVKVKIKEDGSPVTNGDLKVNEIITQKIIQLTPSIPIISEETVDLKKKNKLNTFWLIDPIDGTKEYIAGKDEYTLNAGLIIDNLPAVGIIGVPKKNRIFYSYGKNNSFLLENNQIKKLDCKKKTPNGEIIALTNHTEPPELILNKLKEFGVTSFRKLSSSYKYCVIATGEYDLYLDKVRANEWDDAAGHAIAESAGAVVTSLKNELFKYGKEDYKNPTILIKRSKNLNV